MQVGLAKTIPGMESYGNDSTGPLTVEGRDFGHFFSCICTPLLF